MSERATFRDELLALVKAAFETAGEAAPEGERLLWQDGLEQRPPDGEASWARLGLVHSPASGQVRGIGGPTEDGPRVYHYFGQVFVQLFTTAGDGLSVSDVVSKTLVQALRRGRTPSGALTRNASAVEVGRDGPWYQVNVTADFEYDEKG